MGTIRNGDGSDNVLASGSADLIDGGGGDDFLLGRGGNDTIFGGAGNDTVGGGGADVLIGQGGADCFVFARADLSTGFVDAIDGFAPGVDRIALVGMPQATTRVGFARGGDGLLVVADDAGGDGRVDLAITIAGVTDQVAAATFGSWFVFDPPDLDIILQAAAEPDGVVVVTGQANQFPAGTAFGAGFTFAADRPQVAAAFDSGFMFSDFSLVG